MVCAWDNLLGILPIWMRRDVDRLGRNDLDELRLRISMPPELRKREKIVRLVRVVTADDLRFCINAATQYSPWLAETAQYGYVTAPGGHRIGICGRLHSSSGTLTDISSLTSLCIRVAKDFPGTADGYPKNAKSIIILGKPGNGKTTLLRDLIRCKSEVSGERVAVVDEREEIFPRTNGAFCFYPGKNTDVLSGCSKSKGLDMVMRTMGPDTIAVDEITSMNDSQALMHAAWCGVNLLATAHAENCVDLRSRLVYKDIVESKIFDVALTLRADKSWYAERLK